jgi:hypothetical protein
MSVTLTTGEPTAATAVHELRVAVTVVCTAAGSGRLSRRRTDVIRLLRERGRVTGSVRVPATAVPESVRLPQRTASMLVDGLFSRGARSALPTRGALRWNSATVTVGRQARVLVRLGSAVGPALVGGCGPSAVDAALRRLDEWRPLLIPSALPLHRAPAGWRGLPVLLRPPVAAAVLVAVRQVLTSPAAVRLDGRRVLPPVTLIDRPVEHAAGEPDDAGHPAAPWTLVRDGTVATMPRDRSTGLPIGRAVWQHDEGRLVAPAGLELEFTGAVRAARSEDPADVVELLQCVEPPRLAPGDGRLRLVCLARIGRGTHPFLVAMTGRPLSLLRAVHALSGELSSPCADHLVRTPSLALPTAQSLHRSPDVRLAEL